MTSKTFRLLTIYRPPPSRKNKLTAAHFFSDFSTLLEGITSEPNRIVLAGDFNIHIDDPTDTNAQTFTELIDSAGLQQHVMGPTHRRGHTLDLVLTRSDDNLISNLIVLGESLSDHQPVLCNIDFPRPHATRKAVLFRKTKNIDITRFRSDIVASPLVENGSEDATDLNTLVTLYNDTLCSLLDNMLRCNQGILF